MKRKIQKLAEQIGINTDIAVALSNTLSRFFRKRTSQEDPSGKQAPERIWLWILLSCVGLLVGGGIVLVLFLWLFSNIPGI